MAAVVNVLKAQKLYLKLVECAMNQTLTDFNRVHDLVHDAAHRDTTCTAEVEETVEIISYVAAMCRRLNQPRLTVLISSSKGSDGPARGFWKDLGVKIDLAETHFGAFFCLMRQECYNYFSGFCAHGEELQHYVWDRVHAGLNDESVNGAFIEQVVREQILAFAQASTNLEQIDIEPSNPLDMLLVHKEFFLRAREWLDNACRRNDAGQFVWHMVFLNQAVKQLRREFTLTLPIGPGFDLYALTLAKELKDGEVYMATMDEVEMLTVCYVQAGATSIEHIPLKNGLLIQAAHGDMRRLSGSAKAGTVVISAVGDTGKCTFEAYGGKGDYTHVTLRVSFRLS